MKSILIAIALALLAGCSKKTPEQVVNIGGLELGFTNEQVSQAVPVLRNMTVGGVSSYYVHLGPSVNIDPKSGLNALHFDFGSAGFDQVVEAVSSKYPGLACKDSTVSNPNGASYRQTVCSMRVKGGELVIKRAHGAVAMSALTLWSDAYIAAEKAREAKKS